MGIENLRGREVTEWLRRVFDKIYDGYCAQLRLGVQTKIFTTDTPDNRLLLEEFRDNYLRQRAEFEGWEYDPENFQVIYYGPETGTSTHNPTLFYNPHEQNLGFEVVDGQSGYLRRLPREDADKERDDLQAILDRESQE